MFLNQTWSLWLCHNHIWVPGDPIHTNHATQRPRYLLYPILQKKGLINLGHITLADILDLGLFLCQPESVSLADFFLFALSRQSVSCYCYDCCKHHTEVFLAWGVWSGYSTKRMILLKTLQHLVTFGPYRQNMQISLSKKCWEKLLIFLWQFSCY